MIKNITEWWQLTRQNWYETKGLVAWHDWNGNGKPPERTTLAGWLYHLKKIGSILLTEPWADRLSEKAMKRGDWYINDWGYDPQYKSRYECYITFYDGYYFIVYIGKFWYSCHYF